MKNERFDNGHKFCLFFDLFMACFTELQQRKIGAPCVSTPLPLTLPNRGVWFGRAMEISAGWGKKSNLLENKNSFHICISSVYLPVCLEFRFHFLSLNDRDQTFYHSWYEDLHWSYPSNVMCANVILVGSNSYHFLITLKAQLPIFFMIDGKKARTCHVFIAAYMKRFFYCFSVG